MRDLRFRAWNGIAMEYGGFSVHASHGEIMPTIGVTNVKEDSPIMQFTGLLDKHGKEVYEGDIFTCCIDGTQQTSSMKVVDLRDFYEMVDTVDSYMRVDEMSIKVIGNIYENPDLLGGE